MVVERETKRKNEHIQRVGDSVLDYVMEEDEVWKRVVRVKVENRVESDYFPLVVRIEERRMTRRREGMGKRKWRWTEEGKKKFGERMQNVWGKKGTESVWAERN